MRILALLALVLALAGCHMLRPELPPWARPVPAKSEPAPEAPPEAEASVVPEPATTPAPPPEPEPEPAPAPVTPPPPPPPPAVAPAPAGPPPPPVRAATPQPPAPASAPASAHAPAAPPAPTSPPLTASLPPAEARRLQEEAHRGIDDTEKLLRQLESRPPAPPPRGSRRTWKPYGWRRGSSSRPGRLSVDRSTSAPRTWRRRLERSRTISAPAAEPPPASNFLHLAQNTSVVTLTSR